LDLNNIVVFLCAEVQKLIYIIIQFYNVHKHKDWVIPVFPKFSVTWVTK